MAIEKVINITVNTKGSQKAIAETAKLNENFAKLGAKSKEATGALRESGNAILENGGAMGLLNDATGGVAMTIKDAVEATMLFTKGTTIATTAQKIYTLVVGSTTGALKALRIALVSTGLGAIVVLLGVFISKMNESAEATENEKSATDALNKSLQAMSDLYKQNLQDIQDVTKERVLRAKIAGKSEKDIQAIEKEGAEQRYRLYKEEDARIQREKENKNLTAEQSQKLRDEELANQRAYFKSLDDEKIKGLENDLSVAEAKRQKQKEQKEKEKADAIQAEKDRLQALADARKEYLDKANKTQEELDALDMEKRQKKYQDEKAREGERERMLRQSADNEIAEAERVKQQKEIIEQQKVDIVNNTLGILSGLAKKGSAVAKALAIAEIVRTQVASASKAISNLATVPQVIGAVPNPAYPFAVASTFTGIALSAVGAGKAIKDILSESKTVSGGGAGGASSGGGGGASAPSFNLVQGTASNQIAEGLASERRPLQAYVVAGAVTTQQALDRNIVNDASLG